MKDIRIKPILNGWLVNVGCAKVAFTDVDKMCKELKRYCQNPEKVEKEYEKVAKNKTSQDVLTVDTHSSPSMELRIGQ